MLHLFSPAKINLFLRIVGKRSDGYHELSSLFQAVDLGDFITFQEHSEDVLTCTDATLPTGPSNLILKAVEVFRRRTGLKRRLKIHLDKRIPCEAGLGGGSSNAATALWACNELAEKVASLEDLKCWGAEVGSDVPFFFSQGTAYCTGRGELVHHLPSFSACSLWIVKPPIGLSTPVIYKKLSFSSDQKVLFVQKDLDNFLSNNPRYFNDLEKPAFEVHPELKELKTALLGTGFDTVLMSGSGSAFFCLGEGQPFSVPHLSSFRAQFINRPLSSWYPLS